MVPGILSITRAAALLGMSRNTLCVWVRTIPQWSACISHKSGRKYFLSVAKLQAAGFLVREVAHVG